MNLGGLSTGLAPPASAPLQLFYLTPLFLGLAGTVIAWQGGDLFLSRWTPGVLGVTHFLVLGVIAPVMCGSLLQLAPVLLDAPYPGAHLLASFTAIALGFGALAIGSGLILSLSWLLVSGACLASAGLGVFLLATFHGLRQAPARPGLLSNLRIASAALLVTLGFGLILAAARAGWISLPRHSQWVDTHLAWGLGGWVSLMVAGIGMQLIPLFHLCQGFPGWLKRFLPWLVLAVLCAGTLMLFLPANSFFWNAVLAALLSTHLVFSLYAIYCEQTRERPGRDAHLWLWQVAHLATAGAMAGWLFGAPVLTIGILVLGSALTFLVGSLLKILPFLTWLDLQQRRISGQYMQVKLPRLREILPNALANLVALLLTGALLGLLGCTAWPVLTRPAGALLLGCAILLGVALARARSIHRRVSSAFDPVRAA